MENNNKDENKLYITLPKPKEKEEINIDAITNYPSIKLQNFMDSLQPVIKEMVSNTKYIQEMVINLMQEFMNKLTEIIFAYSFLYQFLWTCKKLKICYNIDRKGEITMFSIDHVIMYTLVITPA